MADTRIQLFDGTTLAFPQGTAQDVIDRVAKQETFSRKAIATNAAQAAQARNGVSGGSLMQAGIDPTEGNSFAQNFFIGAGKAISDTGQGIKQLVADTGEYISPTKRNLSNLITGNQPESFAQRLRRETDETKRRDEPLMNTGGGVIGDIAGNVGMALMPGGLLKGAAAIQGARGARGAAEALNVAGGALIVPRTILGAGAQGATLGAIQPVGTDDERSVNALIGGAAGAAIPAVITGYRGAKSLIDPLTSSGQAQILGRALQEASGGDANLLTKLRGAQELVPGSMPTVGEAANNASIAALQRSAFASTPEVKNAVVERAAQQNTARIAALLDLAGTGGERQSADAARRAAAQKLYDEAYVAGVDLSRLETGRSPFAAAEVVKGGAAATKEPSGILSAIKKLGGIKNAEGTMRDITGEIRTGAGVKGIPPGLFNKGGLGIDDLATQLRDKGYLIPEDAADGGVQFLKNMIRDEINGVQKHLSGFEQDAIFAKMANRGAPPVDIPKNLTRAGDKINALWNRPAMQDAVKDAVTLARNEGVNLETEAGTVKGLDYVGRALQDKIAKATPGSNEARVLTDLRKNFLLNLDEISPKYAEARNTFTAMSKPLNAMDTVQAIANKSVSGINDRLTPAAFARALRDETAQAATGFNKATLANTLSPQQLSTLQKIRQDLQRADFAQSAGKSGSDTVEKLAYNNMLAQTGVPNFLRNFAPTQFMGNLATSGANLLYGNANKTLQKQLAEALLDPKEAAKLLETATPSQRGKLLATILRGTATQAAIAAPASRN